MLLPSIGLTWAIFCSKDGTLTSGTRMTVPRTACGSSSWISRSTATIEAYSVPCAPETTASTGPGFAPLTTATGIERAASAPAGTSIAPRPTVPRAADAVPTRNGSWATSAAARRRACMAELYHAPGDGNLSASVDVQQESGVSSCWQSTGPTTDDRRPTTDDRRQTTEVRGPRTDDRGPTGNWQLAT